MLRCAVAIVASCREVTGSASRWRAIASAARLLFDACDYTTLFKCAPMRNFTNVRTNSEIVRTKLLNGGRTYRPGERFRGRTRPKLRGLPPFVCNVNRVGYLY